MPYEGVDYSYDRPPASVLVKHDKVFACRYHSHNPDKNLTADEAKALSDAGVSVVSNWENTAGDWRGGRDKGREYARAADDMHRDCGGPSDRPIYFSVDEGAANDDIELAVDYIRGAGDELGAERVGVYGSYAVVKACMTEGVATFGWQTKAWSDGKWYDSAHIHQYEVWTPDDPVQLDGYDVDLNRGNVDDIGQWTTS